MGVKTPVDVRGIPLTEGQLVCYTTNARESGLQFGTIRQIRTKHTVRQRMNYETNQPEDMDFYEHRIVFNITDVDGTPKFETRFDPDVPNPESRRWGGNGFGEYVLTDIQSKSGLVQYSSGKFLIL